MKSVRAPVDSSNPPVFSQTDVHWPSISMAVVVTALFLAFGHSPSLALPALLLLASMLSRSVRTVEMDRQELRWFFGLGIWKRRLPLSQIVHARAARFPLVTWLLGLEPTTVFGRNGLELTMRDGTTQLIGTNNPIKASIALQVRLASRSAGRIVMTDQRI